MGERHRGADREQKVVATAAATTPVGRGYDALTHLEGVDTYVVHVGGGLPASAGPRDTVEFSVPAPLLERVCWLLAVAIDHDDARRAAAE